MCLSRLLSLVEAPGNQHLLFSLTIYSAYQYLRSILEKNSSILFFFSFSERASLLSKTEPAVKQWFPSHMVWTKMRLKGVLCTNLFLPLLPPVSLTCSLGHTLDSYNPFYFLTLSLSFTINLNGSMTLIFLNQSLY